jgi:hypothetical protein
LSARKLRETVSMSERFPPGVTSGGRDGGGPLALIRCLYNALQRPSV